MRVRAGPGVEYAIVARLLNGQRVPVLARTDDGGWLLVVVPDDPYGPYGWIATSYVSLDTSLAQVPVAASIEGEGSVSVQPQPLSMRLCNLDCTASWLYRCLMPSTRSTTSGSSMLMGLVCTRL